MHATDVDEITLDALRAAAEPVREAFLYERVRARGADLGAEEFVDLLERLATQGHVRMSVDHEGTGSDPAPFGPRYWGIVR